MTFKQTEVNSNELQAEQQYQRDMAVIAMWDELSGNPAKAGDFANMSVSIGMTYYSYVSFTAAPGIGTAIALGLSMAGIT